MKVYVLRAAMPKHPPITVAIRSGHGEWRELLLSKGLAYHDQATGFDYWMDSPIGPFVRPATCLLWIERADQPAYFPKESR